jgi:uncharacterized membrane protein YccC
MAVPDWLSDVVPDWLADVVRPKKAPIPWADMIRAVFAIWVPLAAGFITGHLQVTLLPAVGALFSVMIDQGGPYWVRVRRITIAGIFGGAAGLTIGLLIHGRGWIAVIAIVVVAGVSAIISRLGSLGSVTGLQLAVYSALGLGPFGALRPWWHTALEFLIGVAWAVVLITPSYLLSPRAVEQRAVANVYHTLANGLRAIGTPAAKDSRRSLTAALNAAYDALLTSRSAASGRSPQGTRLVAILNVSHQMTEAGTALRASGERPPPWVTDTIDHLANAVLTIPGWRRGGASSQPPIPPPWSSSPGALALRDSMVALARAISGSWTPPPEPRAKRRLPAAVRDRAARIVDQLIGGRIAWIFTIRLMLCMGVAAVISEVSHLQRSYWVVLTVAIVLKPDYGSVFARALQRGIGTIVGAVLGAAILAVVPYGPWLLLPFGLLAALLPDARARNFGLTATYLTPFVVLLVDLLHPVGWQLAEERLIDTVIGSAIVLLIGYAPWPVAWYAHLPGQFADTLRAVAAYMDEALVTASDSGPQPVESSLTTTTPSTTLTPQSGLRRHASRSLSDLRAEYQRTMSEPPAVSRRATAWWPAVVGLEEVMDAITTLVVTMSRGGPRPAPGAVHQLSEALRSVADAIDAQVRPPVPSEFPDDPALAPVTDAVRSVLSVLTPGGGEERTASEPQAPAPA